MKQIVSPGSKHETGSSGMLHWDYPEGWDGVGGGSGVQGGEGRWEGIQDGVTYVDPWLIHVDVWQNPPQYCN